MSEMALGPPSITTREEFEACLEEAVREADLRLERDPTWGVMRVVRNQLEAMRGWTADGRTPTEEERKKVSIGVLAMRELDDDEPIASLCHKLNYFFQKWPVP